MMEHPVLNMRPKGNEASRRVISELRARVERLERQVEELTKVKRGRPAKTEE